MFSGCSCVKKLDLSKFNTSNVKNMCSMFSYCSSLTELDLSNLDTENVTDMSWMFRNCSSLTKLNLSKFNTDNVTDMENMFWGCSSLTNLDLSNFNTNNVTHMKEMFKSCFKNNATLICTASTLKKITENKKSCLIIEDKDEIKNTIANDNNNIWKVYKCSVDIGGNGINTKIIEVKEKKEG